MAKFERLHKLRLWLANGPYLSKSRALKDLEISRSTLNRDIQALRDRFGMPVLWDQERAGWYLDRSDGRQHEVQGLLFDAQEVHALLTMQHLLADLDAGGLLGRHIEPLKRRLHQMLGSGTVSAVEVAKRVRVRPLGARRMVLPHFQAVGSALVLRRRILLGYRARSASSLGTSAEPREVSPQRLVHYRDNWYLDAWCHQRDALRSFSVDAIQTVRVLDHPADNLPEHRLDDELGAGYGIFSGSAVQHAQLRFSPQRARWVAAERWHPNQIGRWDHSGHWLLTVPYADPRELVMDILRYLPDVQVIAPDDLRQEVLRRVREGLREMDGLDE